MGSKNGKMEKLENRRILELTRKGKIRTKRNCTSTIEGLERRNREKHAIRQKLEKGTNVSCALMTSPAQNYRGTTRAKLLNKNTCVTSECMKS